MSEKKISHDLSELSGAEDGGDLFLVGTGTSLEEVDLNRLNGQRIMTVNHAVCYFESREPPAYTVFQDPRVGDQVNHWPIKPETKVITWQKFINARFAKPPFYVDQIYLARTGPRVWSAPWTPKRGVIGEKLGSTLMLALEVAALVGASRVYLLGFDGYYYADKYYAWWDKPNPAFAQKNYAAVRAPIVEFEGGRITDGRFSRADSTYNRFLGVARSHGMWRGPFPESGIYNLSMLSAFTAFEKVPHEKVFALYGI